MCDMNQRGMEKYLNKQYSVVDRPMVSEDNLVQLKNNVNILMSENPAWSKEWVTNGLCRRFLQTFVSVRDATIKIKEYFEWRLAEKVDYINPCEPAIGGILEQMSNIIIDGAVDRCGRPIMVIKVHNHIKSEIDEETFKSAIYHLENLCARCDKTELQDFCMIYDLSGFSIENMDFLFSQKYFKALRDYYPERVGVALIINYPFLIHSVWTVVKLWLSKRLCSKFIFCGRKEFNDFVDETLLPLKLF